MRLHEAVRSIVVQELEIEPDELVETALFDEEYDADSLSLLAIATRFEKELGVTIPNERLGEMLSFEKVLHVVEEYRAGGTDA
jgi:acyl carrier protein